MVLLVVNVTGNGFCAPLASPLQLTKDCPASGVAVTVTDWFRLKVLPDGFTDTLPRPTGTTASATCPEFSAANSDDTVGFGFVTVKLSGLAVPLAPGALSQTTK